MYLTINNEVFEIENMTRAFIIDALKRYNSLCTAQNLSLEERNNYKKVRQALQDELKLRHRTGQRLRFKPLND